MQVIIKAKSGLHAGASWVFDKSRITIGSSAQADVFLCDLEIPEVLMVLRKTGRRAEIQMISPEARATTLEHKPLEGPIFCGNSFTLECRHIQLELQLLKVGQSIGQRLGDGSSRLMFGLLQLLRGIGAKAIVALLFLMSLFVTSYVLFFGSVGRVNAKPAEVPHHRVTASVPNTVDQVNVNRQVQGLVAAELNAFLERESVAASVMRTDDAGVTLESKLSRAQLSKLERQLAQLAQDYGDRVSIRVVAALSDEQRQVDQLDVEQVILGEQPVAVLRDGQRVFKGGQFGELKVVDISSSAIVLQGSARYELPL
jgi:hypothetical protein